MASLATVSNGSITDEDDVNQYGEAFGNVFSITTTNQDAPGRLVLPSGTSHPTLSANKIWMRTDLGIGGRLHMRHNNSQTVPYLPMRQVVMASQAQNTAYSITSSYGDITSLSVAITTTGGRLFIFILPTEVVDDGNAAIINLLTTSIANPSITVYIRPVVNSVNLQPWSSASAITQADNAALTSAHGPPGLIGSYLPAAGAHTVKLQAKHLMTSTAAAQILNCRLMVIEAGDA